MRHQGLAYASAVAIVCSLALASGTKVDASAASAPSGQSTTQTVTKEEWGEEVEGFRLSLKSSKKTYARGELVELEGFLQNVGKEARWVSGYGFLTYKFEIIRPDGTMAPLTPAGERERKVSKKFLSLNGAPLQPGQKRKYGKYGMEPANAYFDMRQVGEYQVRASRQVLKRNGSGEATIYSNVVKIRIEAAKEQQ